MVDPIDDIFQQARQGSVAAIIQVLNDKLAGSGIRTRAVFADGVLQLLCEAATVEQLDQATVVERVQHLLEYISPRNIRRVRINSRIVREQQLLWLEEINRDPKGQLLWFEDIILKKPNFLRRWLTPKPNQASKTVKKPAIAAKPRSAVNREQLQFRRGLMGGAVLSVLVAIAGLGLYYGLNIPVSNSTPNTSNPAPAEASDPFADAVRLAEKTVTDGQMAQSSAQWLAIAAQWQKASDLMSQVSAQDSRYQTAQDRAMRYREHSEAALKKAKQVK